MDSDPRLSLLANLTQNITLYFPIINIIMANIGCICNFITFTSLELRKTSCSLYFLGAAIFDLLTIDFGALTRLLADHFNYNLYNQSSIYCKIRQYFINVFPAISTCFIVLAAMDRYMSTSTKVIYRSFATLKRAKWIVLLSLMVCILSNSHYLIFADVRSTCNLLPGVYSVFTVAYSLVWSSFVPHFLMLCFGFGTYYHIRMTRRRILPINNQQRRMQRIETHFVTMMLCQVGISCLLILTRMSYYSYNVITTNAQKSNYEKALDTFFAQLTTQLFYLNYAKSFYLYTLSSKYFRNIFKKRIRNIVHRFFPDRRNNITIHPRNLNRPTNIDSPTVNAQ